MATTINTIKLARFISVRFVFTVKDGTKSK
jgi:hypothetical protein